MGRPSSARSPPCVLRIRNSGSSRREGSQPMPAFWLKPNKFPDGAVSSISADSGSAPAGPAAWVVTSCDTVAGDSNTDCNEMSMAATLLSNSVSIEASTGRRSKAFCPAPRPHAILRVSRKSRRRLTLHAAPLPQNLAPPGSVSHPALSRGISRSSQYRLCRAHHEPRPRHRRKPLRRRRRHVFPRLLLL